MAASLVPSDSSTVALFLRSASTYAEWTGVCVKTRLVTTVKNNTAICTKTKCLLPDSEEFRKLHLLLKAYNSLKPFNYTDTDINSVSMNEKGWGDLLGSLQWSKSNQAVYSFCSAHLHLHGLFDTRWDMYVFDFITEATDPPLVWSLVDGVDDVGIEGLPLLKNKEKWNI